MKGRIVACMRSNEVTVKRTFKANKIIVIFPSLLSYKREQFHSVNGAEIFHENMKTAHVAWLGQSLYLNIFHCTRIYQCGHI